MRKVFFLSLVSAIVLGGCSFFLDSPFSTSLRISERKQNEQFLAEIAGLPVDGTTRIALVADSHQNYSPLTDVINEINRASSIDFAVFMGDFTNLAYNFEYEQFMDQYRRLKVPRLMIPGNHDLVGAGRELFEKLFGVDRFSFVYDGIRFVGFNSNNWEDPKHFSPDWLAAEVSASVESVVLFTHAPLYDDERFLGSDKTTLDGVLADSNLYMHVNGHNHVFSLNNSSTPIFLQVPRVEESQWLILELGAQNKIIRYRGGNVIGEWTL